MSDRLLELLFPPKCPFCGCLLQRGALLCPDCQRDLPWLTGPAAVRRVELTQGCCSALRYTGAVRQGIHAFKFEGRSARSKAFGQIIAQTVQDHGLEYDLISWPSLSSGRLRQRGYDQAELLARRAGEVLGSPVVRTLDKSDRPAQSGLEGLDARRVNVLGAYTAAAPEAFRDKTILLVDDVVTTGATLSECAGVLRIAGARAVVCATLAKA